MSIDAKAYQHALAMNKGKTFSAEGGADECFRYFASCYEAAKASGQPVGLSVVSLMDGARAMHNYAYTNDLSERDGFIQEEYLDNAKACAEAWGMKWKP